ncbi:hypothetical protein BD779DRAFT_1784063 [Infundibulicybe gibba]|nr:hypothetical protein BD779DRAFT_1784063 [Infundibulicybe gibba]
MDHPLHPSTHNSFISTSSRSCGPPSSPMYARTRHATPLAWACAPHRARSIAAHRPSGQFETRGAPALEARAQGMPGEAGGAVWCRVRMRRSASSGRQIVRPPTPWGGESLYARAEVQIQESGKGEGTRSAMECSPTTVRRRRTLTHSETARFVLSHNDVSDLMRDATDAYSWVLHQDVGHHDLNLPFAATPAQAASPAFCALTPGLRVVQAPQQAVYRERRRTTLSPVLNMARSTSETANGKRRGERDDLPPHPFRTQFPRVRLITVVHTTDEPYVHSPRTCNPIAAGLCAPPRAKHRGAQAIGAIRNLGELQHLEARAQGDAGGRRGVQRADECVAERGVSGRSSDRPRLRLRKCGVRVRMRRIAGSWLRMSIIDKVSWWSVGLLRSRKAGSVISHPAERGVTGYSVSIMRSRREGRVRVAKSVGGYSPPE